MSQHLIKEIQSLRHEVDSLRQQQQQQQVQEGDAQFSEDPRTQKILLQLWDHTQQLFRRIKDLEGEFYSYKQEREDPGAGPDPRGDSGKITIGQNRKFT